MASRVSVSLHFASVSQIFGKSIFSTPTLGVVAGVVFVDKKMAQWACVSPHFSSIARDFEGSDFFSPPNLGVASGGSFGLWHE